MKNANSNSNQKNQEQNVEVLYQKMGDRWFAFSVVNEEVFIGSITQAEIDALEASNGRSARTFNVKGSS